MSVDHKIVKKVANLAHIEIKEEKIPFLTDELNKIIQWVEQLQGVDTHNISPLFHSTDQKMILRKDEADLHTTKEDILKNAPEKMMDFFSVPKVIE